MEYPIAEKTPAAPEEMDVDEINKIKEEMKNTIETQKRRMICMEEDNVKFFNEKSYFKEDSENAFKRSKDLEIVFQIRVQDLNKIIEDGKKEIQIMQFKIDEYVEAQAQQLLQLLPAMASQEGREVRQEEVRQEEGRQDHNSVKTSPIVMTVSF